MSSVGMNALVPELADLDARQVERRPENGELKIVNQIFRQSGRYAGDTTPPRRHATRRRANRRRLDLMSGAAKQRRSR
jgi:hypothetical protein